MLRHLKITGLVLAVAVLILTAILTLTGMSSASETHAGKQFQSGLEAVRSMRLSADHGGTSYLNWLAREAAKTDDSGALPNPILLSGNAYSAVSSSDFFARLDDKGLLWRDGDSWIEWNVEIPEDGFYHLGLIYDSANDSGADMVRGVRIDGTFPYDEAERVVLKRQYANETFPPERDEADNDKRPKTVEVKGWKDALLTDYSVDPTPLRWHLTKGRHVIRLVSDQEPMKLRALYVVSPTNPPSYRETENAAVAEGGKWIQVVEAEQFSRKSNSSIQLQSIDSPLMSPATEGHIRYNAIGGEQFRRSGEWIEWEFEVPKDGVYQVGFKYMQSYMDGAYAFRTIAIDGVTPFKEWQHVAFPYNWSWSWSGLTLSDVRGKPMNVYLNRGKHTIRMTAEAGPIKPVYEGLLRNLERIGNLQTTIRKITGTDSEVDVNRDWELEKYIPDLRGQMTGMIEDLLQLADSVRTVTDGHTDMENAFRAAAGDLTDLRDHMRTIPGRLKTFASIQNNLATWAYRMLDQPLMLDYIWIAEPGADIPRMNASWLTKAVHVAEAFYQSFTVDYEMERRNPQAIEVWVNRSRDYVNAIQQLTDQYFTPQTGISVNVNIVPDSSMLILGNISGIQPDVALGVDQAMPIDFATRGALADLSQFPGYHEAAQSFQPGALRAFQYDGKDYALPETQGFPIMAYRTDILDRLAVKPPGTWEDMLKMLPTLQQQGYNFYVPPKDYVPFIYQNGGSFYTGDGMRSALEGEAAVKGFEQWTDLFKLYQLPREIPSFYTHFRMGDIPIGIVDYPTYLQLKFAAPELTGRWKIAPIPGIRQADGTIVRTAAGGMQAGIIFNKSVRQQDAWAFLKWWVSADTQRRFGQEIEAAGGPEFRWNTANTQAFVKLPWSKEDLSAMLEQKSWIKELPQVPGGYFTPRMLDIAWNKVVLGGGNPRDALEQAAVDIDREMARKQIEFGLRDKNGLIVHPLDIQDFQQPWIGGTP